VNIAHIQGIFSPEHGGPAKSLTNYCQSQALSGHRVSVWALEGFQNTSPAIRLPPPIEMHVCRVSPPARLGRSTAMRRQLRIAEAPDIYHLHGAWLRAMHYGAVEAMRRKCPYVVELMGMYEPWSLRQKWVQKRIARWWFQDGILHNAACLHVNSRPEADHLRALGFKTPIAVIPVGVDLSQIQNAEMLKAEILKSEFNKAGDQISAFQNFSFQLFPDRKFLLYLSRLHPKKGLDLLIRSWAAVQRSRHSALDTRHSDWMLAIAGTGEKSYVDECRKLAEQLGIADQCLWLGHVDELQKSWLFTHAHCYVLPTSSENFGNTVAEALAHKTPVITTHHTPWVDLPKHRCGWIIDNTEAELCNALAEAMSINPATRQEMGVNGEQLIRQHYSLESVCKKVLAVYEWVRERGPKPDCVVES
jgi:glycosyltransferase involved in cell wall biosynthesis